MRTLVCSLDGITLQLDARVGWTSQPVDISRCFDNCTMMVILSNHSWAKSWDASIDETNGMVDQERSQSLVLADSYAINTFPGSYSIFHT